MRRTRILARTTLAVATVASFRPGTVVDVQGPVQKWKLLRLGIVRNPNPILVKAVLASVTTPAAH